MKQKLKNVQSKQSKITIDGEVYNFIFDMNALCLLEEAFGDITIAFEELQKQKITAIRIFLHAGLVECNDSLQDKSVKEIAKMITLDNMLELKDAITNAINDSMPESTDDNLEDGGK